ncbi:MAG: NAD(P)/FAD-dependent oxidoreductase [Acidimicrobiales bacterium]
MSGTPATSPLRLAVVGSGISGLTCAHLLGDIHDVTLYEADPRLGGHSNTVEVDDPSAGALGVDTGFIVYNDRTYPNLVRLFAELGVGAVDTEMSFAVTDHESGFTYRATNPNTLLARRRNLVDPDLWRMLADIVRFYRHGRRFLRRPDPTVTVADFLADGGYGRAFVDLHLIPMGAAVWSANPATFDAYPAASLLAFLDNHGLLGIGDRPRWRTVAGGSRRYVQAIADRFSGTIRTGTRVDAVTRYDDHVIVTTRHGSDRYDQVILAGHSDQSLAALTDPTPAETRRLGAIRYQPNRATLHTDTGLLPPARRAWAAWNYERLPSTGTPGRAVPPAAETVLPAAGAVPPAAETVLPAAGAVPPAVVPELPAVVPNQAVSSASRDGAVITYDLSTLQRLGGSRRYLVSLNAEHRVRPRTIIASFDYAHPVFDRAAVAAQAEVAAANGDRRTWFCGAWLGHGFHEDGLNSALSVCRRLGATW